jgi:hypothetical protein
VERAGKRGEADDAGRSLVIVLVVMVALSEGSATALLTQSS